MKKSNMANGGMKNSRTKKFKNLNLDYGKFHIFFNIKNIGGENTFQQAALPFFGKCIVSEVFSGKIQWMKTPFLAVLPPKLF